MGNWHISIQGTGCHHNGKPDIDADLAAKDFVAKLVQQGHTVHEASFTHGSEERLLPDELNTRCNPGELQRLYKERNG